MKLLVIGKEGRLEKHSKRGSLQGKEIVYVPMDASEEEILSKGADADYVLIDAMGKLPGTVIAKMKKLKMIHSEGVGYQGVDVDEAAKRGIFVCNCKGVNAKAVAEHEILLMLGCLRDIVNGNTDVINARQIQRKEQYMSEGSLRELSDCVVGIVGFGDIGKECARLLSAFGAKCLFYNRSPVPEELCHGAKSTSLENLLAQSDIVSLNLPLNAATANTASAKFFSMMKDGAILINAARGELADSSALIDAIRSGKISMAGLDCIPDEPVRSDNPLINAPKDVLEHIIFSPHIAGVTGSSFKRAYEIFWKNIDRMEKGERPERIVNGI